MTARKVYLFPELKKSLISISQLSDSVYMSLFDGEKVFAMKDMTVGLQGMRNQNRLYMIDLKTNVSKTYNNFKSIPLKIYKQTIAYMQLNQKKR